MWKISILNKPLLIILFLFSFNFLSAQQWKEMINDPSINVYEVVAEAESYFQNIDKNAGNEIRVKLNRNNTAKETIFFISNYSS